MKKIDFEAHYYTPFFQGYEGGDRLTKPGGTILKLFSGLDDVGEQRLQEMDANGVDMQIVSLSAGLELMPPAESVEMARRVNDWLAESIARHPDRFRGFAQLPVFDTEAAVRELERCVRELGFVGWNTFSDEPRFYPILEKAHELGVFLYLHPTAPKIPDMQSEDIDLQLGMGFHFDTCITLMKLIIGGVFDRLPGLKVILGHLGEGWPFIFDRLNSKSLVANDPLVPELSKNVVKKKRCGDYWRTNIWCTTSGNLSAPSFRCAKEVLGIEHLLLGTDYPYERMGPMMEFLDGVGMTEEERGRLFHKNAEKFFGLG